MIIAGSDNSSTHKMWNHNTHFHDYLIRQLPAQVHRALDIGCGLGIFAQRLSKVAEVVEAIEIDDATIKEASYRNARTNIRYFHADFLKADLAPHAYDAIVSIASLHHMDLEEALAKMKALLHSSGKLVILGLYQEKTMVEHLYSIVSVPLNLLFIAWDRQSTTAAVMTAPIKASQLSLKQIKAIAHVQIPGYVLRRHLFWRYSLVGQKPQ